MKLGGAGGECEVSEGEREDGVVHEGKGMMGYRRKAWDGLGRVDRCSSVGQR